MRPFAAPAIVTLKRSCCLKELLTKGSIPILLGTGGVGKTTIAAALGLAGASANLNTAVITVDPSERLRDALGLARLGGQPTRIGARQLAAAGLDRQLRLSAMMLDVTGAWDAIVERFIADPATRRRIFDNPFYRSLTAEFAGSEAFAALQRLYDLHQTGAFESKSWTLPPHRTPSSSCRLPRGSFACSIRGLRDGSLRRRSLPGGLR